MNEELHDLAAAYALDALDELDEARFARHLPNCESCQEAVRDFREATVALAVAASESPPPELRGRLLELVATRPQLSGRRTKRPALAKRWAGLAAAAIVAVLALLGWTAFNPNRIIDAVLSDSAALTFVAAPTDAGAGRFENARLVYSEQHEAAVLDIEGLDSLPSDRTYEMWLVDESGAVAAGTFEPGADGRATVRIEGEITAGLVFALTEEPAGGLDQPTGEILLTAEIST